MKRIPRKFWIHRARNGLFRGLMTCLIILAVAVALLNSL
jgi:hypothetical protein